MEFIWNDGGRAASGFVGLAGDCVARSIAIATGKSYREVYDALGLAAEKSPRSGIGINFAASYLEGLGFSKVQPPDHLDAMDHLPSGVVVAYLAKENGRCRHLCCLVDRVIHDTWDPYADGEYVVLAYWLGATVSGQDGLAVRPRVNSSTSASQELNQQEFEKILSRLRALDRTANNHASTEGEKHNALRMMQSLMLRHNLTREDIVEEDNVDSMRFTKMACPVNGRRACLWEKMLAYYVCLHVFPTVQWFTTTQGPRTLFWFYGPMDDVKNSMSLFRELLLTIAASAQLNYGGYSRGSGASYAEGYVQGLPRSTDYTPPSKNPSGSQASEDRQLTLAHQRMMTVQNTARKWLALECGIYLVSAGRSGRSVYDDAANSKGRRDGATQEVQAPNAPKRLTHKK